METCPECGNADLSTHVVGSSVIHECGLCGERFGDRRAVQTMADRDEALAHGHAVEVWPLVRALRKMAALTVEAATAGSAERRSLPAVKLVAEAFAALLDLENLATSMRLGATALLCAWTIELECEQGLRFVMRPRVPPGDWSPNLLREARQDLETLANNLVRDMRLSWWRHRAAVR